MSASEKVAIARRASNQAKQAPVDERSRRTVVTLLRQYCIFWLEANIDYDAELTFDEFRAALPANVREAQSEATTRSWLSIIDPDASGRITLGEFFRWALAAATLVAADAVQLFFRLYDADGEGQIDEVEFSRAARDLGFGERANELFRQLPHVESKRSGVALDYLSLREQVKAFRHPSQLDTMRSFLKAMSWDTTEDRALDTRGWSFSGDSPDEVRQSLGALIAKKRVKLSSVFEYLDTSDDNMMSRDEFRTSMAIIGYKGAPDVLGEAFDQLDDDESGKVGFDELLAWFAGRDTRLLQVKRALASRSLAPRVDAREPAWDVERLRAELHEHVLQPSGALPADLLEARGPHRATLGATPRAHRWCPAFQRPLLAPECAGVRATDGRAAPSARRRRGTRTATDGCARRSGSCTGRSSSIRRSPTRSGTTWCARR